MQAYAEFCGDRATVAPLTWGQYAIWKAIVALAPGDGVLNQSRSLAVPDRVGPGVAEVAKAIGALITRHESLRTRIKHAADGEPRQEVVREGRLPLTIVDCDHPELAAAEAEALAQRLAEPRFDYAGGWPIRVGLVMAGGRVRHLAFAASHAAMDAYAADVVVRELRLLLLRGAIAKPPAWQPVDLALQERRNGARVTARAVEYWLDQYSGLPASMFEPVGVGESPRYQKAALTSAAAQAAIAIIAARYRISTSTVLLTATAALVAAWTGRTRCGLLTISGNRLQPGYDSLVAPTNQLGLVAFQLDPGDRLADLLPRAWKAALAGYRHAYCDPVALNEALEAAGRSHGAETQPYCLFNDVRRHGEPSARPVLDGAALHAALEASTLTWPERFDRFNWRFFLEVQNADATSLSLLLAADTSCLRPAEVERFLRTLERLLVDAALNDPRPADYA